MKFEKSEVWGFEHAVRGMRNPLESWNRSDSFYCINGCGECAKCPYLYSKSGDTTRCEKYDSIVNGENVFVLGKNDLELMRKLIHAGSEHRKFMRQIFVSVDITAPLYWWKEFSTYKVGTVANSTSTMHKLASTPITMDCFEKINESESINDSFFVEHWLFTIATLEKLRCIYNETKDKRYWKELIGLLPESWLQTRTVTMTYENLLNMVKQRKSHKLTEWSVSFIDWARTLPYSQELIFGNELDCEPFDDQEDK